MNRYRSCVIAVAVAFGLALTSLALGAERPGPPGSIQLPPGVKPPGTVQRGLQKPDLMCSVEAYKDSALTQSIPDGGSESFSGPSPKVWFVVKLQNIGNASIEKSFESRVEYKQNGKVVANPKFQITPPVTVGQTPRVVGVRETAIPLVSTKMEVTGTVDSKSQIAESNEANNQCKLAITVALAPGVVGISKVTLSSPSKYSKSFDPPQQYIQVFPNYYDQPDPGQYTVKVTFKNMGPGQSVAMKASGVVTGAYTSQSCGSDYCKDLDPQSVAVLGSGQTQELQWDIGNLPAGKLGGGKIVVQLKSP